jgi:integrase
LSRRCPALTVIAVDKLRPGAERRDGVVRGFGARASPQDAKSFDFKYTSPISKKIMRYWIAPIIGKLKAGELEKAREEAAGLRAMVRAGRCPCAERAAAKAKQATETKAAELRLFASVAGDYRRQHLRRLRSGDEIQAIIARELLPIWGSKPIAEITPVDAKRAVLALVEAGKPEAARSLYQVGRAIFNFGLAQPEYGLASSPFALLKVNKLVGKKIPRTRTLTNDEMRALWRAAETMGFPAGRFVQALALTGLRRTEVAAAAWAEIDLSTAVWTIPPERMKGDAPHVVPIASDLADLLRSLPRTGRFLFSTGDRAMTGYSKIKKKLDALMLVELKGAAIARGGDPAKIALQHFTIHDVRRTCRTAWSSLGVATNVAELLLAHAQPELHRIYDQHAFLPERLRAYEAWHARLRAIIDPPPAGGNVVPLRAS